MCVCVRCIVASAKTANSISVLLLYNGALFGSLDPFPETRKKRQCPNWEHMESKPKSMKTGARLFPLTVSKQKVSRPRIKAATKQQRTDVAKTSLPRLEVNHQPQEKTTTTTTTTTTTRTTRSNH